MLLEIIFAKGFVAAEEISSGRGDFSFGCSESLKEGWHSPLRFVGVSHFIEESADFIT